MRIFYRTYYKPKYCPGEIELDPAHGHSPIFVSSNCYLVLFLLVSFSNFHAFSFQKADIVKGGIVGMFRDPRFRHYSGWRVHGVKGTPTHPSNVTEYIKMYRGCQVSLYLRFS